MLIVANASPRMADYPWKGHGRARRTV